MGMTIAIAGSHCGSHCLLSIGRERCFCFVDVDPSFGRERFVSVVVGSSERQHLVGIERGPFCAVAASAECVHLSCVRRS